LERGRVEVVVEDDIGVMVMDAARAGSVHDIVVGVTIRASSRGHGTLAPVRVLGCKLGVMKAWSGSSSWRCRRTGQTGVVLAEYDGASVERLGAVLLLVTDVARRGWWSRRRPGSAEGRSCVVARLVGEAEHIVAEEARSEVFDTIEDEVVVLQAVGRASS
jgi:hypothetical protein